MMKRTNPQPSQSASSQPTHIAKTRHGTGENASFERIGVAWLKNDGSISVRLHGVQIVSEGFTLYPNDGGQR